jgi:hypothetical protein
LLARARQKYSEAETTASTDRLRARSGSTGNAPERSRRTGYAKPPPREKQLSDAFIAAKEMTSEAAHDIRRQFGGNLTREECLRLVTAFRAAIVPRRRAGRRAKPQVTAAYHDWKAGVRGSALFKKHIPGWDVHNRYHRIGEQKALMDAIRSRRRREGG